MAVQTLQVLWGSFELFSMTPGTFPDPRAVGGILHESMTGGSVTGNTVQTLIMMDTMIEGNHLFFNRISPVQYGKMAIETKLGCHRIICCVPGRNCPVPHIADNFTILEKRFRFPGMAFITAGLVRRMAV